MFEMVFVGDIAHRVINALHDKVRVVDVIDIIVQCMQLSSAV